MKKVLLLFLAAVLAVSCKDKLAAESENDPQANPSSVVTAGNARFTVLTSRLIRMEWSADASFEDRATLTFINRNLPVPEFTSSVKDSILVIKTPEVELAYDIRGGRFDDSDLRLTFRMNGEVHTWTPGADDSGNLMGTTRTLDRMDGRDMYGWVDGRRQKVGEIPLEKGILSRDGWAVVDDSERHILAEVPSHWKQWVESRPEGDRQDLYIFAYGHDYRAALADYSKVAGAAPMPPKYTFGYWWSRYWQYSDSELRDVVAKLRSVDIPVDVLIVDMDWHDTFTLTTNNPPLDEFGQRIGWTGYTWQKQLFPNPDSFMKWKKDAGLSMALNLHPASGIQPYESVYEAFTKDYGWDKPGTPVPFHIDEEKWADSYFKTVLEPMEEKGVDFWWLDWQQWLLSKYTPGLSNTFWLNHTFFTHASQAHPEKRPFLYHRWGGLGSHRYPIAFSGDTFITWASLAYQPEFTATSANVNYGYWGHDLGGHYFHDNNAEHTDPEQYTRWLQYGVFTPIYKTHPTKHPNIERYFWLFPDHMFTMIDAVKLRYALVPYIYNASRRNFDTGVAMCHPLYYDYPENPLAYEKTQEFMFGDDILATSVAVPAEPVTALADIQMWFPEGNDWFDMATGAMHKGGSCKTISYTIKENPWYVKAGSVIPMNPAGVKTLKHACDTLALCFVPGADGSLDYYEDDGISQEYANGVYATTAIAQKRDGASVKVTIDPRKGKYEGASASRSYELRFPATAVPVAVKVNGREIPYARYAKSGEWTYDAYKLSPVIYLKDMSVSRKLEVELVLRPEDVERQADLYGLQGTFSRCDALAEEYKMKQGLNDRQKMLPRPYLAVSQCPNFIMEDPGGLFRYVDDLKVGKKEFDSYLYTETLIDDDLKTRLRAQILGSSD